MKKKILHWYYSLLGFTARQYLRRHKPLVIGINGSVGKTSCRMVVYQTLKKFLPRVRIYTSPKNFNGELGLSLSILQIESFNPRVVDFFYALFRGLDYRLFGKRHYDVLILEYGIDRPGEMDFLLSIVQPDFGVFTAIDAVHSEQFGNPDAIAAEEVKMALGTKQVVFLNADDSYAQKLQNQITVDMFSYQTIGYDTTADIHFGDELFVQEDGEVHATFTLTIKGKSLSVQTNLLGKAHYGYIGVSLVLADILSHKLLGQSVLDTSEGFILDYELQAGRMNIFAGFRESVLVDSSYNAAPMSVRKVINTIHTMQQQLFPDYKIWLVLGDMRELGDLTEQSHRELAGYVSGLADRVFLVGKDMQRYLHDELDKVGYDMSLVSLHHFSSELGDELRNLLQESTDKHIIIFKGSQNTIFLEEAIKKLLDRPEDVQKLPRQSSRRLRKKEAFFAGK